MPSELILKNPMTIIILHSKIKTPVLGNAIPVLGVKLKRGQYVFWSFFKVDLFSHINGISSRRDILNDVAEHRCILKNIEKYVLTPF